MSRKPNPTPDERVCFNCRFKMRVIGGVRGWLCRKPPCGKRGIFLIPSRRFTCENFERMAGWSDIRFWKPNAAQD